MRITNANDFTFDENSSMFITGATRSGKSYLVHKLIDQLKSTLSFEEVKFALFDLKRVEFNDFNMDYQYFDVVKDPDEGLERLDELAELSIKRIKAAVKKPIIFIYIEECDMAHVDQERFDKAVISINQNAKRAKMKLIYSTSRLEHLSVSDKLLASFDLILAGQLADSQQAKQLGIPYSDKLKKFAFTLSLHDDLYNEEGEKYQMLDISKLEIPFASDHAPKDEQLLQLIGMAYEGQILCRNAIVPIELIEPSSDYEPSVDKEYMKYFLDRYKAMEPPALLVYERDGKFIMSDDYYAFHMYKALEASLAICTVIGESTLTDGIEYGPTFQMPLPTIEMQE